MKGLPVYSALAALGLLLGFARELVVAANFGLSAELDVFVAMMGVHLFFGAQVGNALENAFISKKASDPGFRSVAGDLRDVSISLMVGNAVIVALLLLLAPRLVDSVFPAFTEEQRAMAVTIVHGLLAPVVFANVAGLMRGALHTMGIFAPGFLAGSIVSAASVACVLLLAKEMGIFALVAGAVVGHAAVLGMYLLMLMRNRREPAAATQRARRVGPAAIWGAAGVVLISEVLYQASAFTERSLASTLNPGTIAAFFYASMLVSVPLTLVIMPVSTTVFPKLTELCKRDRAEAIRLIRVNGMLLLGFSLLMVAILSGFAQPIVEAVYVRGNFSSADALRTAAILSTVAFVLPALSVARLIRYAFYALSDYRTPVFVNLLSWLLLLIGGSYAVPALGVEGLAMCTVGAVTAGTVIMAMMLARRLREA